MPVGGGANLDAALMLGGGGPKGYTDPAFATHLLPIGQWASAVWGEWLLRSSLQKLAAAGAAQIDEPRNARAVCKGPGAAFVATCRRLGWNVTEAVTIATNDGKHLQLHLDSQQQLWRTRPSLL